MDWYWGILMAVIGGLMVLGAATRSEFIVYKLIHARAAWLWKSQAHSFLLVSGLVIAALGILAAAGVIW